jgi:hypothetical protein
MHLWFPLGTTLVKFEIRHDREVTTPFEFSTHNKVGIFTNAALIDQRLAFVDRKQVYYFHAANPADHPDGPFLVDFSVHLYQSGPRAFLSPREPTKITERQYLTCKQWNAELQEPISYTIVAYRTIIADEAKLAVRAQARQQAVFLRDNAHEILRYLSEQECSADAPGAVAGGSSES